MPRTAALIAIASAVVATTSIPFKFEGNRRLQRPQVDAIVVRPDTVWFCALKPRDSSAVSYAFVRASREWRTVDGAQVCPNAARLFWYDSTPVSLAPGVRVQIVSAPRDSEGAKHGRSHLRLTDSLHGLRVDLKPAVAPERIKSIIPFGMVDEDTTAITVLAASINDSLAWLGLAGGFPEGEGSLGGIYRIDRRSGEWTYVVDSTLSWHTVTGLSQSRDWLWAGTAQPAEYGYFGRAGLLRMDVAKGGWRGFTPANSQLPDALIQAVAADDDLVAVATEKGLAIAELRANGAGEIGRWAAQYYIPAFIGDSFAFRIGPKEEALTDSAESYAIFAQDFGEPGHEKIVFDRLKRVPWRAIDAAVSGSNYSDFGASPSLAPVLIAMLRSNEDARRFAAASVKRIAGRTPADVRAAVRATFVAYDTVHRDIDTRQTMVQLAEALRSFGDSTAIYWARRQLDLTTPTIGPPTNASQRRGTLNVATEIAADARDPRSLRLIAALSGTDPQLDMPLMSAYRRYDSPAAWREAARIVQRPGRSRESQGYIRLELMRMATPTALTVPEVRELVTAEIRTRFRDPEGDRRAEALTAIDRLRLASLTPLLLEALEDRSFTANIAYRALVSLYGRADAPPARHGNVSPEAVSWWKSTLSKPIRSVPRAQGQQALQTWMRRSIPP